MVEESTPAWPLWIWQLSFPGLPWWLRNLPVGVKDVGSIPGLRRSPGERNGKLLQYSWLGNLMDRGIWWATVHGATKESGTIHDNAATNQFFQYYLLKRLSPLYILSFLSSIQFSSVAQSCLTLCDPMDCSTPGLPVHHQLLEFTQTHVHWAGDGIQPSHPLLSPSSLAFNLSQHQGLFKWVSSSHQVAKLLEFQLQHQFFQWTFRNDLL